MGNFGRQAIELIGYSTDDIGAAGLDYSTDDVFNPHPLYVAYGGDASNILVTAVRVRLHLTGAAERVRVGLTRKGIPT